MAESHAATVEGSGPSTTALAHHFEDMEQQREAGTLGMWVFLITEIMFFGGMFLAYTLYRSKYPDEFARGSRELSILLGGINTVVLIGSSLTMAMAVHSAQTGNRKKLIGFLAVTLLLGLTFLGIKAVEYTEKFEHHHFPGVNFKLGEHSETASQVAQKPDGAAAQPQAQKPVLDSKRVQLFFWIYFAMTGMHALHMIIGAGALSFLIYYSRKGRYTPEYYAPVELTGLYWHFVDIVWIFLFPLLYLLGLHE
ncbi:MAG: cytochrome c oxidase subunit 3 family protein [Blastocatellia bacterium]|nr:cytochrome c oxidase subunit 3 family protein [Blastocatellia bacterium]